MKIRKTMLAAVLAMLAFVALPAVASAEIEADYNEPHFTLSGPGVTLTTEGVEASCSSVTGTGELTGYQTGTLELVNHGCKASGTSCASPGASAGTIVISELIFHLVTATDVDGETTRDGVLITPPAEAEETAGIGREFVSYTCAFGLVHMEAYGNGLVGEITSPETNKASTTISITLQSDPESEAPTQTFETIGEAEEEDFDVVMYVNDTEHSNPETAAIDGSSTSTFSNGGEATITAK